MDLQRTLPESSPHRHRLALFAAALVSMTAGLWSFGLTGPYQFDDAATPLADPASHSLAAWAKNLPTTLRPVTKLTYALEAELGFERTPAPRRALSIAIHAASAVVLFLLLARLEPRIAPWGSSLLAVLWAVHPVHAESVLAISGRTAALSGLFLLGALLALERGRSWLAAVLFLLACLSRETALAGTLPLAVVLFGGAGAIRIERHRRWMAATLLAGAGAVTLIWLVSVPHYRHLADYSFHGRPWVGSTIQQVGAVPVGLGLLASPSRLSIDYGIPLPERSTDPLFLLGLAAYIAAGCGVLLLRRSAPAASVGLALWLAALLPTQSVVPKLDALTNRPLSLAYAGLLLALAPALTWVSGRLSPVSTRRVAVTAGCALVALLSWSTIGRCRVYASELTLWADAAAKSSTNVRPLVRHAMLLEGEGRNLDAWREISRARVMDPLDTGVDALWNRYRPNPEAP